MSDGKSRAQKLLEQAQELQRRLLKDAPEFVQDTKDFVALMTNPASGATEVRTLQIFGSTLAAQLSASERIGELPDKVSAVGARFVEVYKKHSARINPKRLDIDEAKLNAQGREFNALFAHATQSIDGAGDQIALIVASGITNMVLLGRQHHGVLRAYLGRPTLQASIMTGAKKLAKAILEEAAGLFVPGLGILKATADVFEPQMDKSAADMRAAIHELDKLFRCERALNAVTSQGEILSGALSTNLNDANRIVDEFDRDLDWFASAVEKVRKR